MDAGWKGGTRLPGALVQRDLPGTLVSRMPPRLEVAAHHRAWKSRSTVRWQLRTLLRDSALLTPIGGFHMVRHLVGGGEAV